MGKSSEKLFAAQTISAKFFGQDSGITKLIAKGEDPLGIQRGAIRDRQTAEKAQRGIETQRLREEARLATARGDVAERRAAALPGRGGRSLLIATSPTGTRARTLGGG